MTTTPASSTGSDLYEDRNLVAQMTDQQIWDEYSMYCTDKNATFEQFLTGLNQTEKEAYFARVEKIIAEKQPKGARKFFHTLGLLAELRFADATEYLQNGDTEN